MTRAEYQDMSSGYTTARAYSAESADEVYAYAPEPGDADAGKVVLTDAGGRVISVIEPHQAKELASEISWSAVFAERFGGPSHDRVEGVCQTCLGPCSLDDAGLGVGHVWTATKCPAYYTLDGRDCTCGGAR